MDYYINPACFTAVFTVPAAVTDKYLKFAKAEHIKVLLYILRNMAENFSVEDISQNTDVSVYDVNEALLYWADTGILVKKENVSIKAKTVTHERNVKRVLKPSREDVVMRGEDPKIKYLLRETELKFGRTLKFNEMQTLVWLYDDNGLDVSLILYIVQLAVQKDKKNIKFIESKALDWIDKGIDNLADADKEVVRDAIKEKAWSVVSKAFGIKSRKPSKKESELSLKWISEWNISEEMLVEAYDVCVNKTSEFSFPYVAKIIETWYNKGYKSPEDIIEKPKEKNKDNFAAYDLDLFEKMLKSKE